MQQYFLGIDVSKGYADFVILNAKKQPVMENFQLDDTFEGHNHLYTNLRKFFEDNPKSIIYAAVESTGGYENNWFNSLAKFQGTLNLKVTRLNPLGVNANSKADLKRNVTDKISAQNVAEYMIAHPEKISYEQQDYWASSRKQWTFVRMLNKQKTQLINQLESLMYNANPELLVYCRHEYSGWLLKLLKLYPTAANLSRAKVKSVARVPHISHARAQDLVDNAKKSVASATDKITGQLITATVTQILHLKKTIKSQTKIMAEECSSPEVDLLKTFVGMSDISAIGLMIEIQSIERFSSAKKLAAFFGLHPVFKVSGDGVAGIHMSKKGRSEPRRILFMVAFASISHNPLIREIYLEHVQNGMEKMVAMGLCMHKILRIVYGMLKNNTSFDPEVDRKNRERMVTNKEKIGKDKSRRHQDYDENAPISWRQKKRRMERLESQSDNITECGIIVPVPTSD